MMAKPAKIGANKSEDKTTRSTKEQEEVQNSHRVFLVGALSGVRVQRPVVS